MKQDANEISIVELEQELAAEEAFEDMATDDTLELPAVAAPDEDFDEDTDTGIYEISPADQYWVAIV